MEFRVLGPVEVAADVQRTTVDSARRRTLLVVLLAAGGSSVSSDALTEALWQQDPPASARKSLQSHLSRLRRDLAGLGADPLVRDAAGYHLDLERHDLDADRFATAVRRAREVAGTDRGRATDLLDEALRLWRGPAFGELADHPAVRPEAVRLERLRTAATADLVDLRLARGHAREVVDALEAAVTRDPLDERAHAQLMLALFRTGHRAEALATFRRLRERLRDQLGVDPAPRVSRLHEQILRHDPALGPDAVTVGTSAPGRQATGATRRGPPADGLVGREEDVTALTALVRSCPLVSLTGPGGVGKTRLARGVVDAVAPSFRDGTVTCALAGVRDPDEVGGALITALGAQPTGDATAEQALVAALGERHLLLLLDNCEHLLAAVSSHVQAVLDRCPNVAVLATSRERLHLSAERVWQVAPLPVPSGSADAEEVARTPAGALFRARASAADEGFELTDANAAAVAQLCRRLDGMPLAIELAAARTRALPPRELVDRLDERFSLLSGGPLHEAGRHRTLQSVVAWSYGLLVPDEARLFDRLSVFAGAFSLDTAEQVCGDDDLAPGRIAGLLGELADKSMVGAERHRELVRHRLLDTLRAYGAQRLDAAGGDAGLRRRHADHHVALAQRLGPQVRGPDEREAVTAIDTALDDLRAAHAWLVAQGDLDGALRLPTALGDELFFRLRDEVTTWVRRALDLPGAAEHAEYAGALATSARGATSRGETGRARDEGRIALARAHDDLHALWALEALTTSALYEGRLDELLELVDRLHVLAEELDEPYSRAFAGVCRALGHAYRGESELAARWLPELMAAAEESGSPTMLAFAHYGEGECRLDTEPQHAAAALERAIALARSVDNALIEGVSQVSLASLVGRTGRPEEALVLFRRVIAHWRRLGNYTHQFTTLRNLVVLLAEIGADEAAAVLHGAVTEGRAPSFGVEAQRLASAWEQVSVRLGPERAGAAARRGRDLTLTGVGAEALRHLDELLAD